MKEIARDLNRKQVPFTAGGSWKPGTVKHILSHPKYIGTLIFNRTEKKLQSPQRRTDRSKWLVVPNAFEPLIDEGTFNAAQQILANLTRKKTTQQLLDDLRQLLAEKGKLSFDMMRQTPGIASRQTYLSRLGSIRTAYHLIGYQLPAAVEFRERLISVRNALVQDILRLFPDQVEKPWRKARYLQLQDGPRVRVRVCRSLNLKSGRRWIVGCDGTSITLAAVIDKQNA
jgi:hypothetical protein